MKRSEILIKTHKVMVLALLFKCIVGFLVDLEHPKFPGKSQDIERKKNSERSACRDQVLCWNDPSNRYLGFSLRIKRIILLSYDYRNTTSEMKFLFPYF